jgi:hypothetical protein
MRLPERSVFLAFGILLACGTLAACSAQPSFLPDEFTADPDSIECYQDPGGEDVACVYHGAGGLYGRWSQQAGEEWYFRCPSTPSWQLSTLHEAAGQARAVADSLLREGATIDPPTGLQQRADCIESFWNVADSLSAAVMQPEPTWRYAEACVTSVDNATLHAPDQAGLRFPNGQPLEPGDTVAVATPSGTCAGYGAVSGEGVTLAAAEADSRFVPEGLPAGAPIRLEIYDRSAGVAWRVAPTWRDCDQSNVPVCRDSLMVAGAFFEAESL